MDRHELPADIHVAASGRTLYVSNRGHNSIACSPWRSQQGALALDQVSPPTAMAAQSA